MHDATMERRWGEITLTMVEVHIRSGLSVPVDLGGGPIGTLDVYAAEPRGWDQSEVTALQAYAGVVASLLSAAANAQLKGALAEQLQTALDSRGLIERAKGALMERERLDDQEASPTYAGRPGRRDASYRRWPARWPPASPCLAGGAGRPVPRPSSQGATPATLNIGLRDQFRMSRRGVKPWQHDETVCYGRAGSD